MSLIHSLIPSFVSRTPVVRQGRDGENRDLGPTVRPVFEIKEAGDAYGVTVFLPGVTKENLDIAAEEGVISIVGRRTWKAPEGWTALYRESPDAAYALSLRHDYTIDVDKIHAELRDGVLRVSLPKSEASKPRKIVVS